ncbi:MAG: ATP-binding cassette domain-containing protein, partial [Acidobacteria bacterium]|nr:ATP-binding cassette domain-containing protein [Acidobacteriota bacterium]
MTQTETRDRRQFLINLALSRAPRAYRNRQNLWRDDLRRLGRLLERQLRLIDREEKERRGSGGTRALDQDVPHLSIAIFGPSGSGKSSLLRTLADVVHRKEGSILGAEAGKHWPVVSLPVMDPTTWRSQDQFLYAFLASALEQEREAQRESEFGELQGLSPTQLAFQEVNEYLRVLDEPEESREYDPLGLSLQKLERHTSGLRLRAALGDFIERLAAAFQAKIVLLPVDDLDMAPQHL